MTDTATDTAQLPDMPDLSASPDPSASPAPSALSVLHGAPATVPETGADVLARFAHWVRRTPDAPAVEDGTLAWSYAEIDALAARTADALRDRDRVRPGEIVAVCLDRSAALVVTALAVARLGAVYLPLGPRPGERRLAAVTRRLGVRCLVGDPALLPPGDGRETLPLPLPLPLAQPGSGADATAPGMVAEFAPRTEPAASPLPEGTHYVVLTSGSTGEPKAVAVGGRSLAAVVAWHAAYTGAGPGGRHSLFVGVAFDPHVMELWTGLTSGAALSVPPEEVRWDPAALTDWWRRARITAAVLPTPVAELVFARPWPQLPELRHLVIGGDRMRNWPDASVTARIHNAYGPAEATVATTVHAVDPRAGDTSQPPPIGTPVDGALVCVTDDEGHTVPRGVPGELRIGGALLALGYTDAELTAGRFVAPPPGVTGTDRVYRTGDRVRMREDGVLEFLGRLDNQVKISGVRIELAEVEAAFERDPRVRRTTVAARETEAGKALVAFVEAEHGPRPETADLLSGVRGWLPEQAVPAVVRYVEEFPLDANGKVDRGALLAAEEPPGASAGTGAVAGAGTAAESAGETERLVLDLCGRLLEHPALDLSDNFMAAGGTSLLAARLLALLEERCGVRLRAPEVLRQPDLRALAALVDKKRGDVK